MRLYENSGNNFIMDVNNNSISDTLIKNFTSYYGRRPPQSEITSWVNSLNFMKNEIDYNKLYEIYLIIEYQLPYTSKRIDCILMGNDMKHNENVILVELKQWSNVQPSYIDGNVKVYIGKGLRCEPHPLLQVEGYYNYLLDFMEIFQNGTNIYACSYCHNYSIGTNDVLFDIQFKDLIEKFPLFTKNDFINFGQYLKEKLSSGNGFNVFGKFINSSISPSKKLVDNVSNVLKNQKIFTLIDEQITANNTIIDRAKKSSKQKNKTVIIVSGGPGTGKSVIALNAMAELLSKGLKVYHATGSKSFTASLSKIVGKNSIGLFKYFNSFKNTKTNEIDVLIADEAHRLRKTSNNRFTKVKSTVPQIDELINVAKVSVFFIDEYQVVRPEEIGSIDLIEQTGKRYNADIYKFQLKSQFRCSGSDGYLNWVDNLLQIRDTANVKLGYDEKMSFEIVNSPEELRDKIVDRNKEKSASARMVAGFCWPWSDPNIDGTLNNDIVIGDFKATWELKDSKNVKFTNKPSSPPWYLWPIDDRCEEQVGSIYTIQGFEFDYIGLIWGNDLIYDTTKNEWTGIPENSKDNVIKRSKNDFTIHVKNIYRTLLTRARYGVYVYFLDDNTRKYVQSMMLKNENKIL